LLLQLHGVGGSGSGEVVCSLYGKAGTGGGSVRGGVTAAAAAAAAVVLEELRRLCSGAQCGAQIGAQ
jgi:hypothetical protein